MGKMKWEPDKLYETRQYSSFIFTNYIESERIPVEHPIPQTFQVNLPGPLASD
jgi:hypothetical protein